MYPVEIVGERVKIRDFVASDLQDMFNYANDDETARFMTFGVPRSPEDTRPFLEASMAEAREEARTQYEMGIEMSGRIVGACGLRLTKRKLWDAEMGYIIRRDHWGQGLMTEAVRLLLGFGFGPLQLHRISATHDPANHGSRRVMEKVGMQFEGLLRENMRNNKGEWRDSELRSILVWEWEASNEADQV